MISVIATVSCRMARSSQWPGISSNTRSAHGRSESKGGEEKKKEVWSTLLDSVASGRKVPERNLVVLGGTAESQKEFIESLEQERPSRIRQHDRSRNNRKVAVANRFALGYTYLNVYDADHEGMQLLAETRFGFRQC